VSSVRNPSPARAERKRLGQHLVHEPTVPMAIKLSRGFVVIGGQGLAPEIVARATAYWSLKRYLFG
jgi:hypothetical protein